MLHDNDYTSTSSRTVCNYCRKSKKKFYFADNKKAHSRSDTATEDSVIQRGENKHTETSKIAETKRNYPDFYSDKSIKNDRWFKKRKISF